MKKMLSTGLLLALLLALAGCTARPAAAGSAPGGEGQAAPLKVVATFFAPYDFVRQIAKDKVDLTMLLPPGSDCHAYEPSPQDIIAIQNSDLFIYLGGDSDAWVARVLESMDTAQMTCVPLTSLVATVPETAELGDAEAGHDHDEAPRAIGAAHPDEHVWTAPQNAAAITQALCDALCGLDAPHADAYRANTESYLAALSTLDSAYRAVVESAARRTLVFADRFPFRYLCEAYGLSWAAAYSGCSTETGASAATVAALVEQVRENNIPVVFYIEFSNRQLADSLAGETGAKPLLLHSVHNVSAADFEAGVTYLDLMEQNLQNLKEALA